MLARAARLAGALSCAHALRPGAQPLRPAAAMTNSPECSCEKQRLRRAVKHQLRQLSKDAMAAQSAAIAARVLGLRAVAAARRLAVYVHCEALREVDTNALVEAALAAGARVYVPRVLDSDSNMHFLHLDDPAALQAVPPFGIREPPVTYADGRKRDDVFDMRAPLDMVVMPGLAFDRTGRRLGRGGGYYDKFIATCAEKAAEHGWRRPLLLALSYSEQLVESVPMAEHDVPVDAIVSPEGLIRCTDRADELG